jgi:cell division protein FtsI/penicillin-binding protein 2
MDELKQLPQIDWWYVIIAILALLVVIKFIWSLLDWFGEKIGFETKKSRERREQKEAIESATKLAKTTAENLDRLQKRHCEDEEEFRNSLNSYMEESRKDRKSLHDEMAKYGESRIKDREQSLEIQKELRNSISVRDEQINALVDANKEMLAEKINEKYKYYISINGIPEDEYDEFVSMHKAYNGVGGNHHGDAKFEYCIEHLPIIPVETRLKYKEKE